MSFIRANQIFLNKPMKLAVINDWSDGKSAIFWNKDGFLRMLWVLREIEHWEVKFFKKLDRSINWKHDYVDIEFSTDPVKACLDWNPDAILGFSDLSRPYLKELEGKKPIALCYTGGTFTDYKKVPDIIFVESRSYLKWFRDMGINAVQAFGTNTEIFKPTKQPKIFKAFFPATFAGWKRHDLFAQAMGRDGLACGWWQPHEPHCHEVCFQHGVATLHHQMPESIVHLYNMSHTCLITSNDQGGSQRSVLEAMACGIPPIVMSDSDKCREYVEESGFGAIVEPNESAIREAVDNFVKNPPDPQKGIAYISSKYTERHYANIIKQGIESIL